MAEVGLPTSLNTRDITCLTINGVPYVPGGGFLPEYVGTVSNTAQFVGGSGVLVLGLGSTTVDSGDFVLIPLPASLQLQASSQPGLFAISATVNVATTAAVTPAAPTTSILQILKNGTVVQNSATYLSVWEPAPFTFQQTTTINMALSPGDTIQIQLVSTDPLLGTVWQGPVVGPPPIASFPAVSVSIKRFA